MSTSRETPCMCHCLWLDTQYLCVDPKIFVVSLQIWSTFSCSPHSSNWAWSGYWCSDVLFWERSGFFWLLGLYVQLTECPWVMNCIKWEHLLFLFDVAFIQEDFVLCDKCETWDWHSTVMHRATTWILPDKCIFVPFHRANVIQCTYTNPDSLLHT